MNPLRKMIKEQQEELHKRLLIVLRAKPTPLYRIAKEVGIAYQTLTNFIADPIGRTLGMKTLLSLDKWLDWKEKHEEEFNNHLKDSSDTLKYKR